jgi:WD40 repeat protein
LATDQEEGTRLDLESGRVELTRGSEKPIAVEPNSIATVPSGSEPIRVSARAAVIASPQRQASFPGLKSVGFSADGSTLVAATRWQAVYWYEDDRLEAVPLGSGGDKKANVKWQSDSSLVFEEKNPRKLVLWNIDGRESSKEFDDFNGLQRSFTESAERPDGWKASVNITAMSPHGDWLAFQVGRVFRIWQADGNGWPEFTHRYDGKPVTAMAASPDGSMLALAIRRTQIDLVDSYDGTVKMTIPLPHQVPFALDFSADGRRLAAGFAGRVKVYEVASGEVLASFEQPGLAFLQTRISPDGRFVAASTGGERVWMWDVETQTELPMFDAGERIRNITFSPSGERLAVVSRRGRLSVWKVAAEKREIPISKSETNLK